MNLNIFTPTTAGRKLYVAHYGHERLKGARHWALILMKNNSSGKAYQVRGSTTTYSYHPPSKRNTIEPRKSTTFMGMVQVGFIPNRRRREFKYLLSVIPIVHNDLRWNCQHWVMSALYLLRAIDFDIADLNHESLLVYLEYMKKELGKC